MITVIIGVGMFLTGWAVGKMIERGKWICAECDDFDLECNGGCGRKSPHTVFLSGMTTEAPRGPACD